MLAILVSACVAAYEALRRLVDPQPVDGRRITWQSWRTVRAHQT